jgi:hypothetical protein
MNDVLIVLRHVQERTLDLARERALPQASVVEINEIPFSVAVIKTWEEGIASGKKWVLALDADVLLYPDAVERVILLAREKETFFRLDFRVRDKFRGKVYAGCHLYNSEDLEEALEIVTSSDFIWNEKRPESGASSSIAEMLGFKNMNAKNDPMGQHDFEQYYGHILAKYYNRGIKDAKSFEKIWRMIEEKAERDPEDDDFKVALEGLSMAKGKDPDDMALDLRKYPDPRSVFTKLGIVEKDSLR